MKTYVYRAYNKDGIRFGGSLKAESEQSAIKHIESKNLENPIVFESETKYTIRRYRLVGPKELSIFCRQMSVMFSSEITLSEGVKLLAEQAENKNLKTALSEISDHMDKATTFAEAACMYPHIFGTYLTSMISIGEESGSLDTVFSEMASYFGKDDKVRRRLRSAITYPAVLTVLMTAIILFLILKILPMFGDLLESMGSESTGLTSIVLAVSAFFSMYLWVILGAATVIVILVILFLRSGKGIIWLDKRKLTFPVARYVYTRLITAKFARSLAILLKSGIQLLNALDEVSILIDNKYLDGKFAKVIEDVRGGTKLSEAVTSLGIFPGLFVKMIIVGESTGRIDEMLSRSAGVFDSEVDEAIEKLTLMVEPLLIIVLSVVVGTILVSVMLPMISVMNSIG